ncbi:GH32 C-terminal domain-containing protein [Ekhidna sp.]|uniref:GH32 C-terminal domain-containing protein n=1 Tax=Ekhidna sp. TaxID=2608089 RepID=UPI003298D8E3
MIRQLVIICSALIIFSCSTSEKEQRQRIPDGTYRPSGFHAFISHGEGNTPISLIKVDSIYHLFYTTGTDEWGHLSSNDLLNWKADISFPIAAHGNGAVIWDDKNFTGFNSPWNIIVSDGDQLSLSYSQDGVDWIEFEDNPILTTKGNPSVSWSSDLEEWILTITKENEVSFYSSQNLIEWKKYSSVSLNDLASKSSLLNLEGQWILLSQKEKLNYQMISFDGSTFQTVGDPVYLDGCNTDFGALLITEENTAFISKNRTTNPQLPTFSTPLSISLSDGRLNLNPSITFQSQIIGKRRAKLSKLLTDGPSWYNFTIEESFEELEIVLSDNTSEVRILWNVTSQKMIITGSALPSNEIIELNLQSEISPENLMTDILIDHASVDLFFNKGAFATSILTLPDSFFSKVEVYLDKENYDAKAVLYDIGI